MGKNKNNDLKYQKKVTLEHSDEAFREKARKVEEKSPIGWTSGMGSENYYSTDTNGLAYYSYTEAVNDIAKKLNVK